VSAVALSEIVAELGGGLRGADRPVERIAPLDAADESAISFLADPRRQSQLAATRAGCVIVAPQLQALVPALSAAIVTEQPYLYYARLTQWWAGRTRAAAPSGAHPSAVIEAGALLDPTASVGALAFVGAGARVGAGVVVAAQCHVGRGVVIGAGTRLGPRVVVGDGCRVGERCVLQPGAVIGADGFGFAPDDGRWVKIEQFGAVVIGDDVEVGANTCIDRGALGDTVIGDGVKLDNLIQIAHNVTVGEHTAMAACVGIAGSTRIGAHCTIGGAAMIGGHLEIADRVNVSAATPVPGSLRRAGTYTGVYPTEDNASWEKNAATLRQLYRLRERVRALEKKAAAD
jgi:UDP-3-O-[3-hydroxymyristoyl] glucosamine N-acyltransferase